MRRYVLAGTALLAVAGGVALLILWLGSVFDGDGGRGQARRAFGLSDQSVNALKESRRRAAAATDRERFGRLAGSRPPATAPERPGAPWG